MTSLGVAEAPRVAPAGVKEITMALIRVTPMGCQDQLIKTVITKVLK
jgi:hypothetical protein